MTVYVCVVQWYFLVCCFFDFSFFFNTSQSLEVMRSHAAAMRFTNAACLLIENNIKTHFSRLLKEAVW